MILFSLGRVVATPGALALLANRRQDPSTFLLRHAQGDWGVLDDKDKQANDRALREGTRLLSAYELPEKLWIVTEADRSATTLLLPEEY